MIYLGIDYGSARIGLAKANSDIAIATPFNTLKNTAAALGELVRIVHEENIDAIVVGKPLSLSGLPSAQTDEAARFTESVKNVVDPIPVYEHDERFSTKSARAGRLGEDASAAALILQTFIDAQR